MTEQRLIKRIAYFAQRMEETNGSQDTPQGKRAYTRARNLWGEAQRQLMCFRATGSIRGWTDYKLD